MSTLDIDRHLDAVLRAAGSGLRYYTMQSTLDAMRKAMAEAMGAGGWQAIETAPKDGTPVLMTRNGYEPAVVTWYDDRGCFDWICEEDMPSEEAWSEYLARNSRWEPTHWMPLPSPPSPTPTEGGEG